MSSPDGPRPPPGADDRVFGSWGPPAPPPPGVPFEDFYIVVGEGELGPLTARVGDDLWHGVTRPFVLPPDAHALFERFGGPLASTSEVEVALAPGHVTFVRRADNGVAAFATYQTDVHLRAVELLAAGVSQGGVGVPDPRTIPGPSCGCDPDTEVCQAGQCACAPEHTRIGEACVPVLGGSYRPAPSCAAIHEAYGATPELAYIDFDGTYASGLSSGGTTAASLRTVRARCLTDGLTEQIEPADPWGPIDAMGIVDGAFRISPPTTLTDLGGNTLVEARLDERGTPSQRLTWRVRSEEIDIGLVPPTFDGNDLAAYTLTRDGGGRLCLARDGIELACRDLTDSPLRLPMAGATAVATAGLACLPAGHDYGADLCTCAPLSCEAAGHECGSGSGGCFDRLACGTCDPGLVCEHTRCLCVPDADEREPTDTDDNYYVKLGLDGEPMVKTVDGFTLDHPGDVDWIQLPIADAAFSTPNELYIRIRSDAAAPITLTVGTAGCAYSCAGATEVQQTWPGGSTSIGCRATAVGDVAVTFRVACDPVTIDAERGLYYARVEAAADRAEACMTYSLQAETRAAATFP